ncbi:hypothetical protein D3C71_1922550 [compost metagenome]
MRAVQAGDFQRLAFQRQCAAFQHLRNHGPGRRIRAQFGAPERQLAVHRFLDVLHRGFGGDDARIREGGHHGVQAEVEVWVAVADVDGGQRLAAVAHHFHHFFGL